MNFSIIHFLTKECNQIFAKLISMKSLSIELFIINLRMHLAQSVYLYLGHNIHKRFIQIYLHTICIVSKQNRKYKKM